MKKAFIMIGGLLMLMPTPAIARSITEWGFDCSMFLFCGAAESIPNIAIPRIANAIFSVLVPVAVIVFMYGGIRMIVSQGGEGKEAGKKAMMYAAVGLALAAISFLIIKFVNDLVYMI